MEYWYLQRNFEPGKAGMYFFYSSGIFISNLLHSLLLFFSFIGHLGTSTIKILSGNLRLSARTVFRILYHSGAVLLLPLTFISALVGVSLTLNTFKILSRFHLESKTLIIAQSLLTVDILPLLIGLVLCIQSALNLISARIKINRKQYTSDQVILEYILPIFIGIFFTGVLLYCYLLFTMLSSLFITFHYYLSNTSREFWLNVMHQGTIKELSFSFLKTLYYCLLVSVNAGYYYYQIAINHVNLRRGVSRILTRGAFWLVVSSVGIKFINF